MPVYREATYAGYKLKGEHKARGVGVARQERGTAQRSHTKGSPRRCSSPLVRLWVTPLAQTREKKGVVLRNTQETGFFRENTVS